MPEVRAREPRRHRAAIGLVVIACLSIHGAPIEGATLPPDRDPLVQNLDPGVRPGDDFFRYANGRWLANNPIPPTEHSWGLGYLVIEDVRSQLRKICEESAASRAARGTTEQMVGDFWAAGMDSAGIERQGIQPLRPELERIDAIRSVADLLAVVARFQRGGVGPLHGMYVGQDDKNSSVYAVFLSQGGLGLPDRDYYVLNDSTTVRIRDAYAGHVGAIMRLAGFDDDATRRATEAVMAVETRLARASRTLEELQDPYANYNKLSLAELHALTPAIDWAAQLRLMGFPVVDSVIVGQPEFFAAVDSSLASVPLDAWKDYLRWSLVNTFAPRLGTAFDRASFDFYGRVLEGREVQRPRWKRVLQAEEAGIGELMGRIWVRSYCSPATKARYERLVDDFFATYAERIDRLDWMSRPTKDKAREKLTHVRKKVAYPERWKDFSGLELDRTSYAGNQWRVNEWWCAYQANKLGKPVDHDEWEMTPQTYNAYYDGSKVEIVLPAGVFLVPGLPDSLMDDAILYANAGAATIGHEITHGFDDTGRYYDAYGNLRPWWTDADSVQFASRAKLLAEQFNEYVVGGRNVRGEATLGENISDLGGLVIGYDAFRRTEQWKKGEKLNGLTPDQRYFLAFAFAWMGHERPAYLDQLIMSDVHAPAFLRVNGAVANVPEFYAAFGIRPGDAMYRPDSVRVRIW